jgi:prefoldin subunit 5
MGNLILDNLSGFAGEAIKLLILIVTGVVLLDRVKNATRTLNTRVAALEDWRDEHISSIEPHTVCILEDRRKVDEREWLERIERKIDRLEERIDTLTEKLHGW